MDFEGAFFWHQRFHINRRIIRPRNIWRSLCMRASIRWKKICSKINQSPWIDEWSRSTKILSWSANSTQTQPSLHCQIPWDQLPFIQGSKSFPTHDTYRVHTTRLASKNTFPRTRRSRRPEIRLNHEIYYPHRNSRSDALSTREPSHPPRPETA